MGLDEKLISLCMEAIGDPDKWYSVLTHIAITNGARAAMISLRDKKTCQIINDDALETQYHSPLIYGFALEDVIYYLQELRTIDPWAEAQRMHYPFQPTIMSKVSCNYEKEGQRFFDWLNQQGIEDTITVELERMAGHWTALNIFLEKQNDPSNQGVLEYINAHFHIIQSAWQASQKLLHNTSTQQALLDQLSQMKLPACICTQSGTVHANNDLFDELSHKNIVKIVGPNKRLTISHSVNLVGNEPDIQGILAWFDGSSEQLKLTASPYHIDPLYKDKKGAHWLLTFQEPKQNNKNTYDLKVLNVQEKKLFLAFQNSKNVAEAGKAIGLKHARTFEVWKSIKKKLDITSSHQLR